MSLTIRAPACRTSPPEGYAWVPSPIHLAFPYGPRDAHKAVVLLQWIQELSGKIDRHLYLFMDEPLVKPEEQPIIKLAREIFTKVHLCPIVPTHASWPGCNNYVFNRMVQRMASEGKPWLLLETDMAPVVPDWVERLEVEYNLARKPFMGSWVEVYDILNGGAIYPPDVTPWIPHYLKGSPLKAIAYDCAIAPEIIWFMHNAAHMMPNVWTERRNGRPHIFGQKAPLWTQNMLDWVVNHNTVLVHRCKTGALIELLREKRRNKI